MKKLKLLQILAASIILSSCSNNVLLPYSNIPKVQGLSIYSSSTNLSNDFIDLEESKNIPYEEIFSKEYLLSLKDIVTQDQYDPEGFLKKLGLHDVKTSGRNDKHFKLEVSGANYSPTVDGKEVFIQKWFYNLSMNNPAIFNIISKPFNAVVNLWSKIKNSWNKPYNGGLTRFGNNIHYGREYGTYAIAKKLGFTDEQADRIASYNLAMDKNLYTTGPSPFGSIDRHFNLNKLGKQDTRLIWAKKHLEFAIKVAKQGDLEKAEKELGCGLHSLQDLFAHGQITPAMHSALGDFPDEIEYNMLAFSEATAATFAYLKLYLEEIKN